MLSRAPACVLVGVLAGTACVHADVREAEFYRPDEADRSPPPSLSHVEIETTTEDGARLRGWMIETPGSTRTILYFYGNEGSVAASAPEMRDLAVRYRADVLCFDYRGYGLTPPEYPEGVSRLYTLHSDSVAAYDFAVKRSPDKEVVALGFSLGTIAALHVGATRPVGAVIVRAPGTSLEDLVAVFKEQIPWYERWLVSVRIEPKIQGLRPQPVEDAASVRGRLAVIHGREDEIIAFKLGQKLFDAASSAKDKVFCPVDGAKHNDLAVSHPVVRDCLDRFLRTPSG